MSRFYHLLIFACIVVFSLTKPAMAMGPMYPSGLNGPSDVVYGVYPSSDAAGCCWMSGSAELRIAVPDDANALVLSVFIPKYAAPPRGQSFRTSIDNGAWQQRCCFAGGMHELAFGLPARHGAQIRVRIVAGATFVPAQLGLNGDLRRLSALLVGVQFAEAGGQVMVRQAHHDKWDIALLAVLGIAILALTLVRPVWGVVALVVTDPFLFEYAVHGTLVTLPKVALVAVALGLLLRRNAGRWDPLPKGDLALLLGAQVLFIASMALSSLHAMNHGAAMREILRQCQHAATLCVVYVAFRRDPGERTIRWALAGIAGLVSIMALAQLVTGAPESEYVAGAHAIARISGPLEGPNQLAGYLGIVIPAVLAFALFRRALQIEIAAVVLGVAACLLTLSKGGIAALAFGIAIVLALRFAPQAKRAVLAGAGALLVAALAGAVIAGIFGHSHGQTFNGGLGSRTDLWRGAYAMWRAHPLLGVGPGNYELLIGNYDPGVRTHANSIFFNVLAEQGAIGFAALLLLVFATLRAFARRFDDPLVIAGLAAAFAMALHQTVDSIWIYQKVGVMFWVVLALAAARADGGAVMLRQAHASTSSA